MLPVCVLLVLVLAGAGAEQCGEGRCLPLCCPRGEVRLDSGVPRPQHRCDAEAGVAAPNLEVCRRPEAGDPQRELASFLAARGLEDVQLGEVGLGCQSGIPASNYYGNYEIEVLENGTNIFTIDGMNDTMSDVRRRDEVCLSVDGYTGQLHAGR